MSLVQELQREAIGSTVPVSELLRKALVVARKLGVQELSSWVEKELKGYVKDDDLPSHRVLRGQLKAENPFHGWIPVEILDFASFDWLTTARLKQPIGELESMVKRRIVEPKSSIFIPMPSALFQGVQWNDDLNFPVALHLDAAHIEGAVEAVRNAILEWSLKLEEDGIIGEGMSFSKEEKQLAATHSYHIGTFIGTMNDSQLQQHTQDSVQSRTTSDGGNQ